MKSTNLPPQTQAVSEATNGRATVQDTKRAYSSLADYIAPYDVPIDVFVQAGWKVETVQHYCSTHEKKRPALEFTTANGKRWRYIDGDDPFYTSPKGYQRCWYGLEQAAALAANRGQPLVICNGERSTVVAQYFGVAACAVTSGEKRSLPESLLDQLRQEYPEGRIIVAFDCDEAGAKTGARMAAQLRSVGYEARAVDMMLSKGGDLADFCKLYGNSAADRLATLPTTDSPGSNETAKQVFQLIPARDLYTLPPPSYLIDGEIPAGGLTVLFGNSGAGKSFAALDYALRVSQQGNVIYIAAEGQAGYADRVAAWCSHFHLDEGGLYFIIQAVKMLNELDVAVLVALVNALTPKLIVVDTLARCLLGGDENSARDMGLFIDACNLVQRETGAAVLVVHHTGKSGTSERGSSALRGAADSMIELAKDDEVITLSCSKSKDSRPFTSRYMRLMEVPVWDGRTSCVLMPAEKIIDVKGAPLSESQRKVLEVLTWEVFATAGAKVSQLWKEAHVPEGSIHKILTRLLQRGYVNQHQRGDPYFINEAGRTALKLPDKNGSASENYRKTTLELPSTTDSPTPKNYLLSHPFRGDRKVVGSESANLMDLTEIEWYASQAGVKYSRDITGSELRRLRDQIPEGNWLAFDKALDQAELFDRLDE